MDKDKMLKLMRFWLSGTFIIVFAAVTLYAGIWTGTAIFSQSGYWIILVVTALLCVGAYYVYKAYLNKQ